MKTGEAEIWLRHQLATIYGEGEASAVAGLVMEHLTGYSSSERSLHRNDVLAVPQLHRLTEIQQRLQQHEPVQYILGEAWFYGMKLYVAPQVLIPRPETEELVHWIIQDVKASGTDVFERHYAEADVTKQLKIIDIGTGSGCIALALKKEMPKAEVWGCDISEEALNIARRNGSELDIRVDFQGIDILDIAQQKLLPTVDIIVSNPPYIPLHEKDAMHDNVVNYEPHLALFVPNNDALKFYEAIKIFAKSRLYQNGLIYLETHENLAKEVQSLFENEGYITEIKKDMQGKERMVKATKVSSAFVSDGKTDVEGLNNFAA